MSILDRYLGGIILQYTLITLLGLLGLFTFVNFIDQLGDLGEGQYGLLQAVSYLVLTMPRTVYELFPMAVLLGTITGLSLLANDSELVAMRAGGVSLLQITSGALKTGGMLVIAAILIGEFIAPKTDLQAQRGRAEALTQASQESPLQQTGSGLWMRDRDTYINAAEMLPDLTLLGIKLFEFGPDKKLRSLVFASDGKYENGSWIINNVKQTRFDPDGNVDTAQLDTLEWQSGVTPLILSAFLIEPDQLSLAQLNRYIGHLEKNRQQVSSYELVFWNKLMQPLSVAVMVVLAIPFVFVNIRSGNLGRGLFLGVMLGLGFHATSRGFGYIVLAYDLPPALGATLPMIAFLSLAVVMMRRVK